MKWNPPTENGRLLISASDIPTIAEAGFKTVICNRPDGESEDQQAYAEIEAAAQVAALSKKIKNDYQPNNFAPPQRKITILKFPKDNHKVPSRKQ